MIHSFQLLAPRPEAMAGARVEPGPEAPPVLVVPLARAADRELAKRNGATDPAVVAADARGLARVVFRHWGDQAPDILAAALELCRVARETGGRP